MESQRTWRIVSAAFGSALAFDALLACAGGPDNVDGRCGAHVEDFSKFQLCFGYPVAAPPSIDCTLFDFDPNGVVNLADFAARTFVLRDRISVFPARVVMTYSQQVDFDAVIAGSSNQSVQWAVMPVPGGEPGESLGSIDANGLYSPPFFSCPLSFRGRRPELIHNQALNPSPNHWQSRRAGTKPGKKPAAGPDKRGATW